ncbi:MAG: hypothetical protein WAX04_01150 [Oscillospiraceae bacterium]
MNVNDLDNVSYLDRIRIDHGTEILAASFNNLLRNSKAKAVQLLNEKNVSFVCLFILLPQIKTFNLFGALSQRNLQAIRFCENIKQQPQSKIIQTVLRWMLTTGAKEESLNSHFDEVLDRAAALLLITYKDSTVLHIVSELMFRRYRAGKCMHDLAWCFFKSQEIDTMPLVANYIRSNNQRDNQLAYKLLNFKPQLQPNDKVQQYHNFHVWLNENKNFLYPTGESMQQTSVPKHWRVDLTAKYLCTPVTAPRMPVKPLHQEQKTRINTFETMEHSDKKMLAKYSFKTHERNLQVWSNWIKAPIETQISVAKAELGGLR